MTPGELWCAVRIVLGCYQGSETSGSRTPLHNDTIGGKPDSPHLVGLGQDVVWDSPPKLLELQRIAQAMRVAVIRRDDHDHFQPADWTVRKEEYLANRTDGRA